MFPRDLKKKGRPLSSSSCTRGEGRANGEPGRGRHAFFLRPELPLLVEGAAFDKFPIGQVVSRARSLGPSSCYSPYHHYHHHHPISTTKRRRKNSTLAASVITSSVVCYRASNINRRRAVAAAASKGGSSSSRVSLVIKRDPNSSWSVLNMNVSSTSSSRSSSPTSTWGNVPKYFDVSSSTSTSSASSSRQHSPVQSLDSLHCDDNDNHLVHNQASVHHHQFKCRKALGKSQ